MQSETGFPSCHQLKSYVASNSRLKLAARAVLSADAGLLVIVTERLDALRCHLVWRHVLAQATLCYMGTQPPPQKGRSPPIFGPRLLWPNGCMDQHATWYGGRPRPTRYCVRLGPCSSPSLKGHSPQFSAHVYCGQTAGWMKTSLGTEVDLGSGHIVLDGIPALRRRGTAAPLFSAHVYCGHGCPSQLLLSSCSYCYHRLGQAKIIP